MFILITLLVRKGAWSRNFCAAHLHARYIGTPVKPPCQFSGSATVEGLSYIVEAGTFFVVRSGEGIILQWKSVFLFSSGGGKVEGRYVK